MRKPLATTPFLITFIIVFGIVSTLSVKSEIDANIFQKPLPTPPPMFADESFADKYEAYRYARYIRPELSQEDSWVIAAAAVDVGEKYNILHRIICAVIATESRFDILAYNATTNCIGLMQIRPFADGKDVWLERLRREGIIQTAADLYEPHKNIAAGGYILAYYINTSKTLAEALQKYNGESVGFEYTYLVHGNLNKFNFI